MSTTVKTTRKQAASILARSFPNYSGRTIFVEFVTRVTFHDTNWSGGSCNKYAAIMADGRHEQLRAPAPWVNAIEGATVDLPTDALIVEHSYFCGKDQGITIYAHPCHLPQWLTAGN